MTYRILFNLSMIAWVIMMLAMALLVHNSIPSDWLGFLEEIKYICLITGLVSIFIYWIKKTAFNNRLSFAYFLVLTTYVLSIFFFRRPNMEINAVVLVIGWTFVTMFFGSIWGTKTNALNYLHRMMWACLIVIIWGIMSYLIFGFGIDFFPGRYALGYRNPNYFSQFVLVFIYSFFLMCAISSDLNFTKKCGKWKIIFVVAGFMLAFAASSRNALVALSVFTITQYVREKWIKIFAVSIITLALTIYLEDVELKEISSGRTVFWSSHINHIVDEGTSSILFGVQQYPQSNVKSYDALYNVEKTKRSNKFRADNFYLEVLVEWGLFGFIFFMIPMVVTWIRSYTLSYGLGNLWRSIMLAIIIQGFFVSTLLSFFAPIALFATFIFSFPFYYKEKVMIKSA